ncbi:hypothetical protein BD770DRAFT_332082 [Pilaira anomala]|nr:hypothetical protein BD770DRAFT_332082 [Pilaira anomala]
MSLVVKTLAAVIPTLVFYPGEMSLDSFDEEYKADGLIKLDSMEVCLLETSGHYGLKDLPRFGYDHIKGSFGALTFIRKLLKTWYFANVDTVLSLKVFFIHVREKKIHLWSLETSMQDVQVLENIISSEIPINAAEAGKMLDFGNLIWKLKDGIKKTCEVVDQMKKEHEEYLLQRQLNPDVEKRINLATFVQQEIQKPVRGSKYGLLLPEHFEDCHQKKD